MTPETLAAAPEFALDPTDAHLFFQQDKMHFPDRLAPMESAMQRSLGAGLAYGARAYDAAIEGVEVRTIGGYMYQAMVMKAGTPEEMAAQSARAEQAVRAVLADLEAAADAPVALYATPEGRAFFAELEAYVDRYGRRADKWTLLAPSWTEDPAPVIERLRDFVRRGEVDEPAVVTATAAAGREQAIAAAHEQLAGYPAAVAQFEGVLAAAQAGTVISEDHNFWIDNMSIHHLRAVLLEGGRRLVDEGALQRAEDAMMLTPEELQQALEHTGDDHRATVIEPSDAMARQAQVTPPPVLGTPPAGPPPGEDPFGRLAMKFSGVPAAAAAPAGEIHGFSGSAGTVVGTARIIASIAEAGRLQPGDILVAETTAPPWTPLFAMVAAVVTDTGGALSHCAVVAREYGIPAVVGTQVATVAIADGDTIEVDGDAGIVRTV